MRKTRIYGITILGIVAMTFTGCKKEQQQVPNQQRALPLAVIAVPQKNVTAYTSYPTTIEGTVNSEVRAKVSGYIQKVLVDEGQKVRKGQALFKLETQSLSQDAGAAKANVNAVSG